MRHLDLRSWATSDDLARGGHQGTTVRDGGLVLDQPAGLRAYTDPHGHAGPRTYEYAAWVSPEVRTDQPVTALIPSWNARTPEGCWIEVELRAVVTQEAGPGAATGLSRWYVLGRWAEGDAEIHPTSVPGQDDDLAAVSTDVLEARPGHAFTAYQLRVSLLRRAGTTGTPCLTLAAVVGSGPPPPWSGAASPGGEAWGTVLDVPAYSQQLHRGEYPQWASGGEAWCSPTSVAMLLGYWGTGPTPDQYAWVDPGYQDRWVDYAARHTFDHSYRGAGNWAFNTAYAARFGLTAHVTRLRSLTEAESYIAAGIPLVVTVSFQRDELTGAGYDTDGHLLTVIGFDEAGDVVSNDPASHLEPSNDKVRTTYDRAEFERAWLGAGGGVAYLVHPPGHRLPPSPRPVP